MSVKVVSPRLLRELARAPEDVLVIYELGLVGLYAGLSKLFRPHKVVSLVEGDYRHIGRTGSAFLKVVVRRLAARFVDVFVANNPPARDYLIRTLNVPEEKIIVGWWLAGMPADLAAHPPAAAPDPEGVPLFVCAGRLIPQKGTDLVIRALAVYRRRFGPCVLWIIGDGPERESPGRAQPSARRRGRGHLPRDGGPPGPQRRLPGLPGVRVPDPPGLHRPRRGGGPERGCAGGGVADDGSGRHDRARRRERDRRGPDGRVGAGRGNAPSRRSGDLARAPRRRPADQRGLCARRRPARWC